MTSCRIRYTDQHGIERSFPRSEVRHIETLSGRVLVWSGCKGESLDVLDAKACGRHLRAQLALIEALEVGINVKLLADRVCCEFNNVPAPTEIETRMAALEDCVQGMHVTLNELREEIRYRPGGAEYETARGRFEQTRQEQLEQLIVE